MLSWIFTALPEAVKTAVATYSDSKWAQVPKLELLGKEQF